MARITTWLVTRISLLSIRSERIPAGIEMNRTGMPMAKLTIPRARLLSLSSIASHTNANRCIP